jgi:hypothetical protein
MKIEKPEPVKIAIFFHEHKPEDKRRYWIGTVDRHDPKLCNTVIKVIKGRGQDALKQAVEYLSFF